MATNQTAVSSDVELLRQGVELARMGKKDEARALVAEACLANPMNEFAWLWRASLAPSTSDAVKWLERVLVLKPNHETARSWLARLRPEPPPAPRAEAAWACPFCSFESAMELARCSDCGGVTVINLEEIEANTGANERQLRYALEHYTKKLEAGDALNGFYLGLAALNLRRSYDAYQSFSQYLRAHPHDDEVRAVQARLSLRKVVLAVDDSSTVRTLVADALERAHYRTVSVSNGVEAISHLQKGLKPDLILMDVSMPVMDGYQLCKLLRGMPEAKNVPVVMLSGNDGFVDKVRGRLAGASDYLIKPVKPETLLAVIRKTTDNRR